MVFPFSFFFYSDGLSLPSSILIDWLSLPFPLLLSEPLPPAPFASLPDVSVGSCRYVLHVGKFERSELEGQRAAAVALKADLKGKEEQLELAGMKARRLRTVCAAHNRRD